ncbi:MAG: hypothetical protein IPJ61_03670 [Tessaracoccus sp.]|uniref:hypothetical protein n=1 Tax=Tessaracoccus sp. TaxID=1971211 RepID=UPI001EB4A9E3|nr:hypothetical protein [Tessaracoccus sp.]MBK7820182.1 hypothetical protein [Tessaracoccus sp.]
MSNQQWTPGQEWQRPQDPVTGQQPQGDPWAQPQPQGGDPWAQPQDGPWPQPPPAWDAPPQNPKLWAQPSPSKPSPFDFTLTTLSLPGSAGLIFLLGTIGLAVEWLFAVVRVFATGSDYILVSPLAVLQTVVGGAGALLVKVLVLRVLIEIGVAVTTHLKDKTDDAPVP